MRLWEGEHTFLTFVSFIILFEALKNKTKLSVAV